MAVRQNNMMETYHGIVRTPAEAIKLFEACRLGLLPRVQRRLSEKERQSIRSGSVFVWDEREAGMRRWTDGKSWSASRVSGSFLTYREMEGKRGGGFGAGAAASRRSAGKTPDSGRGSDDASDDGEPDGYRYKADGLMKQSFSITTSQGQHLHLISYYARPHPNEPDLPQPSTDPSLRQIVPAKGMYPESSMNDQPVPATTRAPMASYANHPHHPPPHPPPHHPAYHHPQYAHQQPYPGWLPSPLATPPYSHYTVAGHYAPPPLPHPHAHPHAHAHYAPHPHYMAGPPPPHHLAPHHMYDPRPALPLPPPPPQQQYQSAAAAAAATQPRVTPPILPPYNSNSNSHSQPASATTAVPHQQQQQQQSSSGSAHTSPYLAQVRIKEESPRVQPLHFSPTAAAAAGRSMPGPLPPTVAHQGQQHGSTPPPPPRTLSQSPSNAALSSASGGSINSNKASLSALLHPSPADTDATSTTTAATGGDSSPRSTGVPGCSHSKLGFREGFREDFRALDVLNKNFSSLK